MTIPAPFWCAMAKRPPPVRTSSNRQEPVDEADAIRRADAANALFCETLQQVREAPKPLTVPFNRAARRRRTFTRSSG
jgi:hypothetical protein